MRTAQLLAAIATACVLMTTPIRFVLGQEQTVPLYSSFLGISPAPFALVEATLPDGALPSSSAPVLSTNSGRQIAFNCWVSETYQVCLMNTDGTGVHQLTASSKYSVGPLAWSHDGKKIAFSLEGVVYTMNADGSSLVRLSPQPGTPTSQDFTPDWSPSDRLIIFANINQSADTSSIWTMKATDGGGGLAR